MENLNFFSIFFNKKIKFYFSKNNSKKKGELIPESYDAIRDGDKITATVGRNKEQAVVNCYWCFLFEEKLFLFFFFWK